MNAEEALKLHEKAKGKISVSSKVQIKNKKDLSLVYTPGVAEPSKEIFKNKELVYKYTSKGNLVLVVTDGSAVLGLGNVGAEAALPVMEGKCILFKLFAGIDAFPICLATQKTEEIIETIKRIAPAFGGINLEDISAPRCFEIEEKLKKELDIPIFHDDQHGTAIVVLAGLINALKVTDKEKDKLKTVINGAGASGIAVTKSLLDFGVKNIIVADSAGLIYEGRKENMNPAKEEISKLTNKEKLSGKLADVIKDADLFIGLSVSGALTEDMVASMKQPIIFALANPMPEIMPDKAKEAGAVIVATGRSDFPNQINNALGFPGIFRGALDAKAKEINEEMKLAAAKTLAGLVDPTPEKIIPDIFDKEVVRKIASAVKDAAEKSGAIS